MAPIQMPVNGGLARIPGGVVVVAFAIAVIAGIWIFTDQYIRHDVAEARASEVKQNDNLVLAHEEQVRRLLKEVDQLLLLLKNQYERRGVRLDLRTLFADRVLDPDTFTFVGVIDEHGNLIATGREAPAVNLADREYFKDHQRSDSSALRIGEPVLGRASGRLAIPLTRRVNKPDGSFGGVVDVAVDASHFTSLFQKSDLGPSDVMALVRKDGIVLARRLGRTTSSGEDVGKSKLMSELKARPAGSYESVGVIDHSLKFYSYRTLADYPVIVTVGTAEADALAPAHARAELSIAAAVLSTLVVIAFCALILAMLWRQKRANARIRNQLELIDQARDAIVVRGTDGRVEFWNKGAERVYGWMAAEVAGKPLEKVLTADPAKFAEATQAVLASGEWCGESTNQHRDGRAVTVDDHWTLLRDGSDQPASILAIQTDITRRLATEAQLRQSQRLEAVGQLTGGVAHDFNNLLTVILGNSETLTEKLRDNPELRKLAEMTLLAASRGAELTGRLLAFARRQALEPKPIDPNKLLMGMQDLLRRTLNENIEIEMVHCAGLWQAMVDPGQLEGAILNLCLNARDAMPQGGRLTIETANARIDADYAGQHVEVYPGQYVLIIVSDTGVGIPANDLNQVFDPFFTTKSFGKGTGLGLSMVYGFVKQSRGHIKIYSEVGHGTAVKVYLPRADTAGAELDDAPATTIDFPGTERILLVEDDEFVRRYAEDQLVDLGYCVSAVSTGAEALELLKRDSGIDLLFTDVVMPGGMSGRELAEQAGKLFPSLKVLYTSGYTENSIVHHGRLDKGVLLLNKPYRRVDLAQKVRAALSCPAQSRRE